MNVFKKETFKIKVRVYPKPTSFDILRETPEQREARREHEAHPSSISIVDVLTYKTRNLTFKPSDIPEALRCSHLSTSRKCETGTCYLMEPGGKGYRVMKCDRGDEEGECNGHMYNGDVKTVLEMRDGLKFGKYMWETRCFGKQGERVVCIEGEHM